MQYAAALSSTPGGSPALNPAGSPTPIPVGSSAPGSSSLQGSTAPSQVAKDLMSSIESRTVRLVCPYTHKAMSIVGKRSFQRLLLRA